MHALVFIKQVPQQNSVRITPDQQIELRVSSQLSASSTSMHWRRPCYRSNSTVVV